MTIDFSFPDINFEIFKKIKNCCSLYVADFGFNEMNHCVFDTVQLLKKMSNRKNRSLLRLLI